MSPGLAELRPGLTAHIPHAARWFIDRDVGGSVTVVVAGHGDVPGAAVLDPLAVSDVPESGAAAIDGDVRRGVAVEVAAAHRANRQRRGRRGRGPLGVGEHGAEAPAVLRGPDPAHVGRERLAGEVFPRASAIGTDLPLDRRRRRSVCRRRELRKLTGSRCLIGGVHRHRGRVGRVHEEASYPVARRRAGAAAELREPPPTRILPSGWTSQGFDPVVRTWIEGHVKRAVGMEPADVRCGSTVPLPPPPSVVK